ncbi:hypothetical protein [Pseudogulbenkiania sp. MAI-1]|uniref:hypothetical protein n=1 Tax=Pseudogulbenkiania sp. MAI-1 TaxID=990370 RepID=UPI00045E6B64|nr:hypothetical protein [Pseudogulbenkiania sp. MAI-1]
MIRTTVPLVLLAMLGGGALGLWVSAPPSPPASPFRSIPTAPPTPVLQPSPAVAPQTVRISPAVGQRGAGLPFEADV